MNNLYFNTDDIICAIATASGKGAISIIRISGDNCFKLVDKIFKSKKGLLIDQSTHSMIYGSIFESETLIDEVLIGVFKNPNSYTGEDSLEIYCHASTYIQQKILSILNDLGIRLAQAGEFSFRAFRNGKMDLSQTEAVADLIASESESAHKIAINQLRGGFSNEIKDLKNRLVKFTALIELELDFGEEDVEFVDRNELINLIDEIKFICEGLIKSFELGNAIKNGIPVSIVGAPNVGKSTLLNSILNEDKAIVSDIAGTTRDSIEDVVNYNGISYRFIDTAGIRETKDVIESLGIEKTIQKIEQSSIVLCLFDISQKDSKETLKLKKDYLKNYPDKDFIFVYNKSDLLDEKNSRDFESNEVFISAKKKINIDSLLKRIGEKYSIKSNSFSNSIVSNIRHKNALQKTVENLIIVKEGLLNGVPSDLLTIDIRTAIHYLSEISGEINNEDILDSIFRDFCIGK